MVRLRISCAVWGGWQGAGAAGRDQPDGRPRQGVWWAVTGSGPGQRFLVRSAEGVAVVTPPAEIDLANAGALREALAAAGRDHVVVVVDLAANEFCDSTGISALVMARKQARAAGGEVRLVLGSPAVRRVFKVTGVDQMFRIFDSLPEAVAAAPASVR